MQRKRKQISPRPRKPRHLGFTGCQRPKRVAITLEKWCQVVRYEQPGLTDEQIVAEAKRLLRADLDRVSKRAWAQYKRIGPTSVSVRRKEVVEEVEEHAIVSHELWETLRETFCKPTPGRPCDRRLAWAVFSRMALSAFAPQVKHHRQDLVAKNNANLHWAYSQPVTGGSGTANSSINETLKAALQRSDPRELVFANVEAIKQLVSLGHKDIGRWIAVDGTNIVAPCEQRPSYSVYEEDLLREELGATYVVHTKGGASKYWRGWTLMVIIDLKTTLPLVWSLKPAHRPESEHLRELIETLFAYWPDVRPETISGDKAYALHDASEWLETDFGIHPVFPLRDKISVRAQHADSGGTPRCHGLMRLEQSDGWVERVERDRRKLAPGETADFSRARHRWVCETCGNRTTTRPENDWRLYTFLPREGGEHIRAGLRAALKARHNAVESLMGSLKKRGFGERGLHTPKWIGSDTQMRWLAGANCLAITMRRLVYANGDYRDALEDARAQGLLEPPNGMPLSAAHVTHGQQGLRRGRHADGKRPRGRGLPGHAPNVAAPCARQHPPVVNGMHGSASIEGQLRASRPIADAGKPRQGPVVIDDE